MKKIVQSAIFAMLLSPVFGQWNDQNSGITNDLESVHFISQNEGWAVGRQGKVIHTSNAGVSWSLQNSGTTSDLNRVFMVSASCGFAVGDDGAAVKYNGSTWSSISSGTSQDLYGVYFLDANTGWISGDWAIIKKTTNGGSSFSQENTSALSNTFRDLHMFSATEGWAVGSTGGVWKYNGSSWNGVTTPTSGGTGPDLYSVSFSSPSNGFMTGQNSSVYHYDGTSWSAHSTSLPDNSFHVYGVQAINDNLAYAATTPGFGGQGYILKYNGTSWTTDYQYSGMNSELFSDINFPVSSKGYAVGAGGMIKSIGSGGSTTGLSEATANSMNVSAYPNPFAGQITVTYSLQEGNNVNISVYDLSGKQINAVSTGTQNPGNYEYQFDGSGLSSGIYYISVESGNAATTIKMVK